MVKCPWCGSSAQIKHITTDYKGNGWTIETTDYLICGCGQPFTAKAWFKSEGYEEIEPICQDEINKKLKSLNGGRL